MRSSLVARGCTAVPRDFRVAVLKVPTEVGASMSLRVGFSSGGRWCSGCRCGSSELKG